MAQQKKTVLSIVDDEMMLELMKEDLMKAINSGGIDYIVKPFDFSDFLARIRKIAGVVN